MKLYFNGCSGTYGDGLEDPKTQSWPTLVSKELNYEFLNDAVPGGSNLRTVNKTVQNIHNYDCFFIQWTFAHRFTLYDPENQWEVNFTRKLINQKYESLDKFKTFGKYYFTYWENPYTDYINWLSQIILLQSLFKLHQKKYVMVIIDEDLARPFPHDLTSINKDKFIDTIKSMINISNLDDTKLFEMRDVIDGLLAKIDKSHFVDNGTFAATIHTPKKYRLPDGHGDAKTHQQIADKVLLHFKKFYQEK